MWYINVSVPESLEYIKFEKQLIRKSFVELFAVGKKFNRDNEKSSDPDVIRTRNLLIWSQTRYHCATESL